MVNIQDTEQIQEITETDLTLAYNNIENNIELNNIIVNDADSTADNDELSPEQFTKLKLIIEAILMASDKPFDVKGLVNIIEEHNNNPNTRSKDKIKYNNDNINLALEELTKDFENRAIELKFLGAGYRIQTKREFAPWVQYIWQEKPSKYSKATLETLAIIAYRQPITRSEIENIRGVAVSSQIIRTLLDREWIKVVGHRDLPGRPAIYATTQQFLFDLNLSKLEDLPTLADIKEIKQDLFTETDLAMLAKEAEPA